MDLGDMNQSAPVQDIGKLTKMNFDWSFNNDELLINLNMQDREINKQTIYITVRDVEDLNGNPMASPVTWTTFVDRNSLKWEERRSRSVCPLWSENGHTATAISRSSITPANAISTPLSPLPDWLSVDDAYGVIPTSRGGKISPPRYLNRDLAR